MSDRLTELVEFCEDITQDGKRGQIIPPFTCPKIDEVIEAVEDAQKEIDRLSRELSRSDDDTAQSASRSLQWVNLDVVGKLEAIRSANEELRDLGKKWYLIAKEMSERVASECEGLQVAEHAT